MTLTRRTGIYCNHVKIEWAHTQINDEDTVLYNECYDFVFEFIVKLLKMWSRYIHVIRELFPVSNSVLDIINGGFFHNTADKILSSPEVGAAHLPPWPAERCRDFHKHHEISLSDVQRSLLCEMDPVQHIGRLSLFILQKKSTLKLAKYANKRSHAVLWFHFGLGPYLSTKPKLWLCFLISAGPPETKVCRVLRKSECNWSQSTKKISFVHVWNE